MTTESGGGTTESEPRKVPIFGICVDVTTYDDATRVIIDAARLHRSFAVTALATHGLMMAVSDPDFGRTVNEIDLVTPDGQPVRWALNSLGGASLGDRVYGPTLTLRVCAEAERSGLSVYLLGSSPETCRRLEHALRTQFPSLRLAGVQPDRFREATPEEDCDDVERIRASGAHVVLVGRGCPRQERWVAAHKGQIPAAMLAVGAAFDYIAGTLPVPPPWMQRFGLEWLYRLRQEPRRLWKRYFVTNSQFVVYFSAARVRAWWTGRTASP